MEWWQFVVLGVASVAVSIFSGIAGGGGGFVMTPLLIFLGLAPAQAVSTGKISGLTFAIGTLSGMRSIHGQLSKWRIIPVMALAFLVGLVVPFVIKSLDSDAYRITLGIILLLMIPVLLVKKVGLKAYTPKTWQKYVGSGLLALAMFLQGVFSGGLGTLINVVLMGMLGMTATEANVTKRWSQLILNSTIVLGVLFSGLIVWQILLVLVPASMVGGYIGGKIAVKKGNKFVLDVMIVLMVISALLLIFGVSV
ncbi:MAG TPA: sulfite exporter TauE/SafE family protein [Candidatus Saccharimonadales bacterium]|nr:sulfite exporter TauE/SafE family protein [Candidatus Saccharimonadales bacterium]